MVKQLKQLKMSAMKKKPDAADDKNVENKNDQSADGDIDNSKLTDAIAKLVASIPKPSCKDEDENSSNAGTTSSQREHLFHWEDALGDLHELGRDITINIGISGAMLRLRSFGRNLD